MLEQKRLCSGSLWKLQMSRNINAHNFFSKYIIYSLHEEFTKIIVDTVLLDSLGTLQRRKHKVLRLSERTVMKDCA